MTFHIAPASYNDFKSLVSGLGATGTVFVTPVSSVPGFTGWTAYFLAVGTGVWVSTGGMGSIPTSFATDFPGAVTLDGIPTVTMG